MILKTQAELPVPVTVPFGGSGATTLTGFLKGNGTSAFTASATVPSGDLTGTAASIPFTNAAGVYTTTPAMIGFTSGNVITLNLGALAVDPDTTGVIFHLANSTGFTGGIEQRFTSNTADADGIRIGDFSFALEGNTGGSAGGRRLFVQRVSSYGASATNRGGKVTFSVRPGGTSSNVTDILQLWGDSTNNDFLTARFGSGTTQPTTRLEVSSDNAVNNAATDLITVLHTTSGSPSVGIGSGIVFGTETSASNNEIGSAIRSIATNVGSGTEAFDLVFYNMTGGATATEGLRVSSAGSIITQAGTIGTAAYANTGTIGATVPLLTGNNTQSGTMAFNGNTSIYPAASNAGQLFFGMTSNAYFGKNGSSGNVEILSATGGGSGLRIAYGSATSFPAPGSGTIIALITDLAGQFYTTGTERLGYDATGFYTGTTASKGRFSVTGGKTVAISNTLTFTGTDSSSVAFGAGGTVAYVGTSYNATAAGTAYTLTNSTAAVDFGTTDPEITIAIAGNYYLYLNCSTAFNAATFAGVQSVSFKLRRTNNTAADIGSPMSQPLPVITALTGAGPSVAIGPFPYTATAGDIVTIFGVLSASPGAGSVTVDACNIVAIPR